MFGSSDVCKLQTFVNVCTGLRTFANVCRVACYVAASGIHAARETIGHGGRHALFAYSRAFRFEKLRMRGGRLVAAQRRGGAPNLEGLAAGREG